MEINLVSSVGDAERATEHTCTAGEMRHWKPKLKRQVATNAFCSDLCGISSEKW